MAKKRQEAFKAKEKKQKMHRRRGGVRRRARVPVPAHDEADAPGAASQPTVIPTATTPPPNSPLPTSLGGAAVAQPAPADEPVEQRACGLGRPARRLRPVRLEEPVRPAGRELWFGGEPFLRFRWHDHDAAASTGKSGSGKTIVASVPQIAPRPKPAPPPPAAAPAAPTQAVISVNGTRETVAVSAEFPASSPTFVLRSLTRKSAKIAVAGRLAGGRLSRR